jgi:hypothetical protein
VLNEPETSLHPDLLAPLAQLIITSAERSQLIVVSHSQPLITTMEKLTGPRHVRQHDRTGQALRPDPRRGSGASGGTRVAVAEALTGRSGRSYEFVTKRSAVVRRRA